MSKSNLTEVLTNGTAQKNTLEANFIQEENNRIVELCMNLFDEMGSSLPINALTEVCITFFRDHEIIPEHREETAYCTLRVIAFIASLTESVNRIKYIKKRV